MFEKNPFESINNNEVVPTLEEVVESLSCDQDKMGKYLQVAMNEPDKNVQPTMMIKRIIQLACTDGRLNTEEVESDLEEGRKDYAGILMQSYLSELRKIKERNDLKDMSTQAIEDVGGLKESIVTNKMKEGARLKMLQEMRRTGMEDPEQNLS